MSQTHINEASLTAHLFKNEQEDQQIMKNFKFKFPQPHQPKPSTPKLSQKHNIQTKSQCSKKSQQTPQKLLNNCFKIDNKASIVDGKLIFFQTDMSDIVKNGRKLMKLLKQNNISYKDYMQGDKQMYHKMIAERQKMKQEMQIQQYISKHINMEKTTKIQVVEQKNKTHKQLR